MIEDILDEELRRAVRVLVSGSVLILELKFCLSFGFRHLAMYSTETSRVSSGLPLHRMESIKPRLELSEA